MLLAEAADDTTDDSRGSDLGGPEESWPERLKKSDEFNMFIGLVIMLSTIGMAIETDYPHFPIWDFVNLTFLSIFAFEILLRLYAERCFFFSFKNPLVSWNYFDLMVVLMSFVDQVVMDLMAHGERGHQKRVMKYAAILRTVRILRILRVLRLFKAFSQLGLLVGGLLESMRSVIWIAILQFMVMLVFAIFFTEIVGHSARCKTEPCESTTIFENPEDIEVYWGTVPKSLVTLFQFLTFDDWTAISREVTDAPGLGWLRIVFDIYIFIAAFAILSLLTGVVTDHMSEVSQTQRVEMQEQKGEDVENFIDSFQKEFDRGGGRDGLTLAEFQKLLRNRDFSEALEDRGVEIDESEAAEVWECLDTNANGRLSWKEFKAVLRRAQSELQPKDMLRIRFAADSIRHRLKGGPDEAETLKQLGDVNDCIKDMNKRLRQLHRRLGTFLRTQSNLG